MRISVGIVLLLLTFLGIASASLAEPSEQDIRDALKIYMDGSAGHGGFGFDMELYAQKLDVVMDAALTYADSRDPALRSEVAVIAWKAGTDSQDPSVRSQAVEVLVRLLGDEDGFLRANISKYLKFFDPEDFDETVKEKLRAALARDSSNMDRSEVILLCGVAGLTDQMPCLQEIARTGPVLRKGRMDTGISWKAHLALARLGSKADIRYCIDTIEALPRPGDRLVRLGSLAYIRQPEIIPVLKRYLDSDAYLCRDEDAPTLARDLATDILTPILEGTSARSKRTHVYTEEDVKWLRKWMNEHKDYRFVHRRSWRAE